MRSLKLILLAVAVPALVLAGCSPEETRGAGEEAEQSMEGAPDTTQQVVGGAIVTAQGAVALTEEDTAAAVHDLESRIEKWKTAVVPEVGGAREQLSAALSNLGDKERTLEVQFQDIQNVGAEQWQALKGTTQTALDELRQAYDEVVASVPLSNEEYIETIDARLSHLDERLGDLENRFTKDRPAVGEVTLQSVGDMKGQLDSASEELDSLKETSADGWEAAKADLDSTLDSLEGQYHEVAAALAATREEYRHYVEDSIDHIGEQLDELADKAST
ncbi:MAG: hypothetical protein AB1505_14250 [Candidatus Latescibacterota bacterium]